jgi:transmembrane sensor
MRLAVGNRIDDEARDWVYRIAAGEPREACAEWCARDPAHDAAFREAWRAWQALADTPTARGHGWRDELQKLKSRRWYQRPTARVGLPTALAASLAALVMIRPGMAPVRSSGAAPVAIATQIGQDKVVSLKDGSKLTVGARSSLAVKLDDPRRREVVLKEGEAFFEVAHNPDRPFYVIAGDAQVRVVGTKFDVRRVGDDVQVSVLEGRVEVRRRGRDDAPVGAPAGPARVLTAGEESTFRPEVAARFEPEEPVTVTPGEWRFGRRFYVDAQLKDIIADANRYSAYPIRVDPKIGTLRMTTSFRTADTDGLLTNIEATLKLQSHREPDGAIKLDAR